MAAKRDYYEVLGVNRSSSAEELRKAHRKLVRQYHPDANRDKPDTGEKFKEVQEAYDVLSDPDKRRLYDEYGHGFTSQAGQPPSDANEAFRHGTGARTRAWKASPNVTVEDFDMGAGGGFSDIFEQLFGGRTRGRGARQDAPGEVQAGEDIEHAVSISFDQAVHGATLPLQIFRGGHTETIELKIPSGVKDGSRVRVRGKGHPGRNSPNGDLYIITRVADHPYFRREDLNVYLEVPVSVYEAILGAKIDVPTIDQPVTITIPPGTSGGAKLRIKDRGIRRGNDRGDQYVIVKVVVPKHLDDEDRRIIERLATRFPINARKDVRWAKPGG